MSNSVSGYCQRCAFSCLRCFLPNAEEDEANQQEPPRAPVAVQLQVSGLAGPICSVEADDSWILQQVCEVITARSGIPTTQQVLVFGTSELENEELPLSLALQLPPASREPIQLKLSLIRIEEPPAAEVLWQAVAERRRLTATQLLQHHKRLPGLNSIGPRGRTILHEAISRGLTEVALAILARTDFRRVNEQTGVGFSVLHVAAWHGNLLVATVILQRPDFRALTAQTLRGETARNIAFVKNHHEIDQLLTAAEERLAAETGRTVDPSCVIRPRTY